MAERSGWNRSPEKDRRSTSQSNRDQPWRVVVIEDNPADVFLIRQALQFHAVGGSISVVSDGESGFDLIDRVERGELERPDLFILDLSLPRRSGPELLERIKKSPVCSGARVVIASSSHHPMDKSGAFDRGADRYFVKPSSFNEFMQLGAVISELLDQNSPTKGR